MAETMIDYRRDALIDELRPRTGWRRSLCGNLTRGSPSGARMTVFELYRSQVEAAEAVWAEVEAQA